MLVPPAIAPRPPHRHRAVSRASPPETAPAAARARGLGRQARRRRRVCATVRLAVWVDANQGSGRPGPSTYRAGVHQHQRPHLHADRLARGDAATNANGHQLGDAAGGSRATRPAVVHRRPAGRRTRIAVLAPGRRRGVHAQLRLRSHPARPAPGRTRRHPRRATKAGFQFEPCRSARRRPIAPPRGLPHRSARAAAEAGERPCVRCPACRRHQHPPACARACDYLLAAGRASPPTGRSRSRLAMYPGCGPCCPPRRRVAADAIADRRGRGVDQYLDLGCRPAHQRRPPHETARAFRPAARVAYVDRDPRGGAATAAPSSRPASRYLAGDLAEPEAILASGDLAGFIDFSRPVCLVLTLAPAGARPRHRPGRRAACCVRALRAGQLPGGDRRARWESGAARLHAGRPASPPTTWRRSSAGLDLSRRAYQRRSRPAAPARCARVGVKPAAPVAPAADAIVFDLRCRPPATNGGQVSESDGEERAVRELPRG